jgi:glycerate kinase
VRIVIVPDAFAGTLTAEAAAAAIAEGWRRGAPRDELRRLAPAEAAAPALAEALRTADLVLTGEGSFDWHSLRDTVVTAVAEEAAARGIPCLVLAGEVRVGRREAAAIGVQDSYSVAEHAGRAAAWLADPAGTLAALAEELATQWSGSY